MTSRGPFDYIKAINKGEKLTGELTGYNQFLVNRAFSYHIDTLPIANEANMYGKMTDQMHYDFMSEMISPKPRFSKWYKPKQHPDAVNISVYFGIPLRYAYMYLDLFSENQLKQIEKDLKVEK